MAASITYLATMPAQKPGGGVDSRQSEDAIAGKFARTKKCPGEWCRGSKAEH
jgi:hypothetical protein